MQQFGRRAPPRGATGGRPAEPPLLQLQRTAGNRAVLAMLSRAPTVPARAGPSVRRVVLDADVFDQIARGNIQAANTLRELAQKHEVYVSWQAFHEWVIVTKDRKQANTVIRIIETLRIKSAPPAPSAVLTELRAKNTFTVGKGTASVLASETDLKVAAEAKAINAEVWSFDRSFRNNSGSVEKTLGVKVAPETKTIKRVGPKPPKASQSRALRILGIKDGPIAGLLPEGKGTAPPASTGGSKAGPVRLTLSPGTLKKMLKSGFKPKARPGSGNLVGAIGAMILQQHFLKEDVEEELEVATARLSAMLESGLDLVFRNPDEKVYANVVLRVVDPAWAGPGDIELPPYVDSSHTHVFFDVEPRSGVLQRRRELSGVYMHNISEDIGTAVDLDDILEHAAAETREAFAHARQRGREELYRRSPQARPLSHVSSAPREDPLRRE